MAITTAAKFEYDIVARAKAKKIPPNALKIIIQKLFGMATFDLIPDKIHFIEESKAYEPTLDTKGEALKVNHSVRLLVNGVDTLTIGLRPGEGTDAASVEAYIFKGAKAVYDLSPWIKA